MVMNLFPLVVKNELCDYIMVMMFMVNFGSPSNQNLKCEYCISSTDDSDWKR